MRLLTLTDNGELSLTSDLHDDDIPPYAILSHTWGADGDEVTFADLRLGQGYYGNKAGFKKIEFCGAQSGKDGIQHFWVDTCCIDKANNTELTEAITSMYKWYRNAQQCYVYLADVQAAECDGNENDHVIWKAQFRKSRWFKRGWTLQELLAPQIVAFFSSEGRFLGTREALAGSIQETTGIPIAALYGAPPSQFSISERWRWTQGRQTKRREDKAYCLLGLFDVFMPLIYGEGDHAFRRLEKEVKERSEASSRESIERSRTIRPSSSGSPSASSQDADINDGHIEWLSKRRKIGEAEGRSMQRHEQFIQHHENANSKSSRNFKEKCRILFQSLAFDRMDARLHNVADALPNTCQWLLRHEHFRSWIDTNQVHRHGGFLWIKGKPGSGKSTIMKATTTWAEQARPNDITLSYFFNARSPDQLEKSSLGLYRSLVHQLLTVCPEFQLWLGEKFSSKERQGKVVDDWKQVELQNFLSKVITAQSRRQVTLFIDALDEEVMMMFEPWWAT